MYRCVPKMRYATNIAQGLGGNFSATEEVEGPSAELEVCRKFCVARVREAH